MKKSFFRRAVALLLCFVMTFMLACSPAANPAETPAATPAETPTASPTPTVDDTPTEDPENGSEKIIKKTYTMRASLDISSDISLAHYESVPDILLTEIEYAVNEILNKFFEGSLPSQKITVTQTETTVTLTRENGSFCVLDFVDDTIFFDNFDLFAAPYFYKTPHDFLSQEYVDENGNGIYFERVSGTVTNGMPILIELANRDIPLDIYEGEKYIPLQTFCDLFLVVYGISFVFNGQDVFLVTSATSSDQEFVQSMYMPNVTERSDELTIFTYNELGLFLDLFYGLSDQHGFDYGFPTFMEATDLYLQLADNNPEDFFAGMCKLTLGYMADSHSGMVFPSPYCGSNEIMSNMSQYASNSLLTYVTACNEYTVKRAEVFAETGNDGSGYQEIGNTAYITFDSFLVATENYYENFPEEPPMDTMGLIIYAHDQIYREDSPIENVVIDLSCNGGGQLDAAIYVVSWVLGYCNLNVENPITGAKSSTSYRADVNLDGVFDEYDTIMDKNVFCLTSPVSFSCGNLVPAMLKESSFVTLIGEKSSGGSCAVLQGCTTADGTAFVMSSPYRFSTVTNGSYYHIDGGIEPHFKLTKLRSYYDREALTEFINGLY